MNDRQELNPERLASTPWDELTAREQWELVKQAKFAEAWANRSSRVADPMKLPPGTYGTRKYKAPGVPSYRLEQERGYVT